MDIINNIKGNLLKGNIKEVKALVEQGLKDGVGIKKILEEGLIAAMDIVGQKFKNNEIFVPEVMLSAKAMHAGLAVLEPFLVAEDIKPVGKIVVGTVKGDLHDIGKNLVVMMFKGAGFEVLDCGIDVAPERFAELVSGNKVDIIAMSSLLTTSMPYMKTTIEVLKDRGFKNIKTMIGGAPVTQDYADRIGADGYAPDASSAVDKAKELIGIKKVKNRP